MCEANAYLKNGDHEVLLMESVDIIEPYEEGLKLVDIFGRQKFVKAHIKDMTLLNHRIVLVETVGNDGDHGVIKTSPATLVKGG
ncbi:putative RNA-binding protein [Desulfosporosinus acididurans]|uniref:Putative RNA-binding protein n=1 Tax=Desulfosporosinus acididurans TaxID=476652 RepID=A0A0J1FL88_9FIRM|nr:CooT family nickel-binding protein [Desulfosporosinus acididurans]KLU63693.1 putative RNA-binding protein [Desulfosporosinus acididurans]